MPEKLEKPNSFVDSEILFRGENFRIVRIIGIGSSANVYMLQSKEKKFAIKISHHSETVEDLFFEEAKKLRRFNHTNIPQIYSQGFIQGHPFIIMELLDGHPFSSKFPRESLIPPAIFIPVLSDISHALDYIHAFGIIHRDVKPNNFLSTQIKTYLTDFGISIDIQQVTPQDNLGPAHYIAPEQIQGYACAASDQYSLGISAYTWLTGKYPYHDNHRENLLHLHLKGNIKGVNKARKMQNLSPISPLSEEIVMTSLSLDPSQRFSCCGEFMDLFRKSMRLQENGYRQ